MRSLFAALAVVALFSACSDEQPPTSPAAARPSAGLVSGAASNQALAQGPTQQAKPTDEVGLTTVTLHEGTVITTPAGEFGGAYAICPVGTASIGGGHQFVDFPGTHPFVSLSIRTSTNTQTGWVIGIDNTRAGAGSVRFRAYVLCIS
jgi:hypothetical protein